MGTLELLLTRPISLHRVVLGKYLGVVLLILIAVVPTLLYLLSIHYLGLPQGNWDLGSTLGSYFGLIFLILTYASIGVFASSLSGNQIVSFMVAAFGCFLFYFGFDALSELFSTDIIGQIGLMSHFDSMARGVLDTRDLIYFVSVALLFLGLTQYRLASNR